jgi:hypothetical protein
MFAFTGAEYCVLQFAIEKEITIYRTVILPVDFTGVKPGRSHLGRNVS